MRRIMSTCVNLNNCQVFAALTYSLMHIGTMYINKSSKATQVVHVFQSNQEEIHVVSLDHLL